MFENLKNNFGVLRSQPEAPLQEYTPEEIAEMKEFVGGRHQPEEWDAFFKFWSMSRRMRTVSRVSGVLLSMLGF